MVGRHGAPASQAAMSALPRHLLPGLHSDTLVCLCASTMQIILDARIKCIHVCVHDVFVCVFYCVSQLSVRRVKSMLWQVRPLNCIEQKVIDLF